MSSATHWTLISLLGLGLMMPIQAEVVRIDSQDAFARHSGRTFAPGDQILFARGARFSGMFVCAGQGRSDAPIRIGADGDGDRPRIDALGVHPAALLIRNPSFVEVAGLEVTNTDGSTADQGGLFGIHVLADEGEGVFEHVYISDCHVHDVNGEVAGKQRGGIHVHIRDLEASRFHGLRITGNRVERVGGVGIGNNSSCAQLEVRPDGSYDAAHLWTNVYVADNHVERTGRNCIIARASVGAIYERNVLAHSSRFSTGHSIFNFRTDGIKIQYNEAYGNVGPGGKDRGGFDADYNAVNTYIQYNYSHDNQWFCGIMKRPNHRVTIRYNVSQNDTEGIYFYGFEGAEQAADIHIYNNTHYVREGLEVEVFPHKRSALNSTFENNIFSFAERGEWGRHQKAPGTRFENNVYVNIAPHPTDPSPVLADPMFVDPGTAGTGIDLETMDALGGYRLQLESPCREGATLIDDNGGQNIMGEALVDGPARFGAL